MKKRDLMKQLRSIAKGAQVDLELIREGSNHELWSLGGIHLIIPAIGRSTNAQHKESSREPRR